MGVRCEVAEDDRAYEADHNGRGSALQVNERRVSEHPAVCLEEGESSHKEN